jgi:hypothetical protein
MRAVRRVKMVCQHAAAAPQSVFVGTRIQIPEHRGVDAHQKECASGRDPA